MRSAHGAVDRQFLDEVARLRASGVLGESGRLLELFDFLAVRGPDSNSVSQAEIAEKVFGQLESVGDDPTARVYVHRLRKRLDDFYAANEKKEGNGRLILPSGTYALRFARDDGTDARRSRGTSSLRRPLRLLTIPFVLMILVAGAWLLRSGPAQDEAGVLWRPLLESDRPIMIVLGDYYIFGEYESQYPEVVRLVRDFEVNSPTDLVRLQESDPGRYARTEDMGLNYLPFSSAYGLSAVMPILAGHSRPLRVMPASQVSGDTLRDFNIVYIGLVSGMGQLEQVNFAGSNFSVGENYDELVDNVSTESYLSEEVYSLPSPRYYRDYGYFSTFDEPGGATVMVIAGARDTGLRGMASLVSDPDFNGELEASPEEVDGPGIEAIVEIIGQQGTDLKHRLVAAHNRTNASPGRQ